MAVQRRTVWFTDEDWQTMEWQAGLNNMNVSQFIRSRLYAPITSAPPVHVAPLPAPRLFTPAPKPGKR